MLAKHHFTRYILNQLEFLVNRFFVLQIKKCQRSMYVVELILITFCTSSWKGDLFLNQTSVIFPKIMNNVWKLIFEFHYTYSEMCFWTLFLRSKNPISNKLQWSQIAVFKQNAKILWFFIRIKTCKIHRLSNKT